MVVMTTDRELAPVLLDLLPVQGNWSEEDYLWLTDGTNRLIEYTDGYLEVLPTPTEKHQRIVRFLFLAFYFFTEQHGGTVFFSPLRVRVRPGKYREPDLLLVRDAADPRRQDRYWLGADLVVEIVSTDKPERDLVEKRRDYAEAAIPEYWIVNPLDETITVLRLADGAYVEHGVFARVPLVEDVVAFDRDPADARALALELGVARQHVRGVVDDGSGVRERRRPDGGQQQQGERGAKGAHASGWTAAGGQINCRLIFGPRPV